MKLFEIGLSILIKATPKRKGFQRFFWSGKTYYFMECSAINTFSKSPACNNFVVHAFLYIQHNTIKCKCMINQYEVLYCLRDEFPQLSEELYPTRISSSVYTSIQRLSDYTQECLQQHHLHIDNRCFCIAETFFKEGDRVVKNAVENIFIDSLCSFLKNNIKEEVVVQSKIPAHLFGLYLKHKKALAN